MRRNYGKQTLKDVIERICEKREEASIGADIIVGLTYKGENKTWGSSCNLYCINLEDKVIKLSAINWLLDRQIKLQYQLKLRGLSWRAEKVDKACICILIIPVALFIFKYLFKKSEPHTGMKISEN